jgi:hypothetical protein
MMKIPLGATPFRRTLSAAYAAALSALLAGCVDEVPSPLEARPHTLGVQTSTEGGTGPDLVVSSRFALDLEVDGALKPGRPIHFTVRGSARFATGDAEVRLTLPEVTAAERSSWDLVEIPVGTEMPPHFRMRKAFAAGESFRERATVTIPEPGYYSVLATVIQHSDDPRIDEDGHVIGTGAGRELWLWIDERGGSVTERFDPTLFPEGMRRVRGPLGSEKRPPRVRDGDAVITCSLMPGGGLVVSSSPCPQPPEGGYPPSPPANATSAVTVTYTDAGTGGTTRPLVDAWVAWKVFNTATNGEIARSGAFTNASGASPVIDCQGPSTERRLEVTVHTENRKAIVESYINSNPDRTQAGQYFGSCGGAIPITADNQQAHLFLNFTKNWDGHQRAFLTPPTMMKARLYPNSIYGSRYDWGNDYVRIEAKWDHIWGEQAVMVAAHEWGHLWQDQYLFKYPAANGLKRFYDLSCPNPHPAGEYTTFGCAFGEAFADWYAVVVRENDLPGWKRDLEENRLHLLYCGNKCSTDGSIVQGAVHAFLWDITDPAFMEPHDRVQKTPLAVADAIKGCEVTVNRVDWRPYTGIDHLIWCMERRFPYQVRLQKTTGSGDTLQTFFNTRPQNQWANDARGFSVDNFSDDFRRLWLVNLYSRRVNVGTAPIFRVVSPEPDPTDPPCGGPGQLQCPTGIPEIELR